jgi:hypothetical protein
MTLWTILKDTAGNQQILMKIVPSTLTTLRLTIIQTGKRFTEREKATLLAEGLGFV